MLINPLVELEHSYLDYIKELGSEERYPYPMDLDCSNFPAFVQLLNDYSKGINLPNHMVPNTTFWLIAAVHIHCYKSNIASAKLIESSGATLDSTVDLEDGSETVLRFTHEHPLLGSYTSDET